MKYAYFFLALAVTLLFNGCKSDNFENTKRLITTDKDEYELGDQFELTLTIYPLEGEKQIRIYKNYKNLEVSFALVNPSKGIQNENWSHHSGQSLKENEIMEISISNDKPFIKTFTGKIEDRNSQIVLSIPELNLYAPFDKAKILDGTSVRIHGFCNPISPVFADALEDYFEVKDIKIVETSKKAPLDLYDFNVFLEKFKKAVSSNDSTTMKLLTHFPLKTRGPLDSDPIIKYSEKDFIRIFSDFLKRPTGINPGETQLELLLKTSNVEPGKYQRIGEMEFEKVDGKWKLVFIYYWVKR